MGSWLCWCYLRALGRPPSTVPAGGADDVLGNALNCNPGSSPSCPNLRDAIAYANAGDAGATPTIQLGAGSFVLSTESVFPNVPMTISGAGDTASTTSTIDQTGSYSVLDSGAALTLQDLIVTGGAGLAGVGPGSGGQDDAAYGSAIDSSSSVMPTDSTTLVRSRSPAARLPARPRSDHHAGYVAAPGDVDGALVLPWSRGFPRCYAVEHAVALDDWWSVAALVVEYGWVQEVERSPERYSWRSGAVAIAVRRRWHGRHGLFLGGVWR